MRPLLLCAALLCALPISARAATHRFALVVGQNLGHDPTRALRFAERDAQKVRQALVQLGGFPRDQVVLLTNTTANALARRLKKLERRIARVAQRAQDRALVVFYYSGHADADRLELGKTTLAFSKISSFLKQSKATVRLAWIDSCFSGRLVAAKGARPKAGFNIRVTDQLESRGYAVITSSAADEASQESAEVRGSLFTHYLVSGLRGAADASRDGRVTLSEAYRFVYARTVARTSAHVGGGQHPTYDFQLQGRGEVVLTQLKKRSAQLVVQSPDVARVVVIDQRKEQMIAESNVLAGHPARLALPAGDYAIYLLQEGSAYRARARLKGGQKVALTRQRHFRPHALREAVAKGGLFRPIWSSHFSAAGLVRRGPLAEQPVSFGAGLIYRLELPAGWQPTLRLLWGTAPDRGASTGYQVLGGLAGLGYRWRRGPLKWRAEALIGYEHLFQSELEGESRNSGSFAYLGSLGGSFSFGDLEFNLDGGVGGRLFKLRDDGTTHRLDLQLLLGLGWRWEH